MSALPLPPPDEDDLAKVLDLFEEHVYAGEITPDGRYVSHRSGPRIERFLGGVVPPNRWVGFWDSRIHADDRTAYDAFNERLGRGEDAEVTYRLLGLDGVERLVWDRARPIRAAGGAVRVAGIISDVTSRNESTARFAEASERFARLLDVVGEHVYVLIAHPDGHYEELFQGPGADRLLGGAFADADMENWDAAVHPDDRAAYAAYNGAILAGEDADSEYRLIGADGVTRWVHDRARCRRLPDGSVEASGIVSDVTERRRLEDELRRTLAVMQEAHRELERARADADLRARTDELTGAYNRRHFTEVVAEALAADPDGTGLLLLDADHFKQVNDRYGHLVGDAVLVELAARLKRCLEPGEDLARWGGEEFGVLRRDVLTDGELTARAERLRAQVAETPIMTADIRLDLTISIGAIRAGGLVADVDALVDAADRGLYAAKRAGRNRSAFAPAIGGPQVVQEPEAIATARTLASAIGVRGGVSNDHAGDVAELATAIAEHLGLAADAVLRCRLGGWLHDVGKIAIPPRILEKPGPLNEDEWDVMRTHPVIGEEIVAGFAAFRDVTAAVRHHHERFDGTGYPDGLAGSSIPIEARIVAAADAYSAMTANRVYSTARTPAAAAVELRRSAGLHLDPLVVATLLAVLGLEGEQELRAA